MSALCARIAKAGFSVDRVTGSHYMPGAGSQGSTVEETVANTKESIEAVLTVMKERGEPVAAPRDLVITVSVAA